MGEECGIRSVVTATGPQTGTQCAINSGFLLISTGTRYRQNTCLEFIVLNFDNDYENQSQVFMHFHPLMSALDSQRNTCV